MRPGAAAKRRWIRVPLPHALHAAGRRLATFSVDVAMPPISIRRPDPFRLGEEADAAMAVQRAALRATLPGLREPHTAVEDAAWIRDIFAHRLVWLAVDDGCVVGIASHDGEWVNQLYIAPGYTGKGIGKRLL